MKTLSRLLLCSLMILAGLLSRTAALAQNGSYTQNVISVFVPGPAAIEFDATPNTSASFRTAVATAWTNGSGGVFNFPTGVSGGTTNYYGNYGNAKRIRVRSSTTMQNITSSAGSFTVLTPANGTTSSADLSDYTLTFGLFDTNTMLPLTDEAVKTIGLPILSRNNAAGYPLDLRVTVTYSDSSTQIITTNIGLGSGTHDTFFGFTAPENLNIVSVRLQSFAPGTETPRLTRIAWDDFGFITGSALPQPQIVNVAPPAYIIMNPTNGVQFQAFTFGSIPTNNISLVINSVDVSNQLLISGDPTNYSVAYFGLAPGQEYQMTISVTNGGGVAVLQRTFYTITNGIVLYDSDSFTNDTLYPPGALTSVSEDRATWFPDATAPAQIVNVGGLHEKVLERPTNPPSLEADVLAFQPFSSGQIIIEFDAFVSTTLGRTMDISMVPSTGGTEASFLAWGDPAGKLAYHNNVTWIPLADLTNDWHHVVITNYLSGIAAGKYDVFVDGVPLAQKISWRNAAVGSIFNQFRIQANGSAALFESGRIDNLVITAAPEDPNTVIPPQFGNLSQGNNIVAVGSNFQFNVVSLAPISGANVTLLLNGNDVTSGAIVTGPSTNLLVSYNLATNGTYVFEIGAYNSAGSNHLIAPRFVVTDEAWMLHPGDGWVSPWQWTSGIPEMPDGNPLDTAAPYLRLNITGGARNFMREYQSGTVNINQPHYIRWKFRMNDADFLANYTSADDRVHFFAHPVSRITASTTGGNSWAIVASGGPNMGVTTNQAFFVYNNVDGTGAFTPINHVNSEILVVPDHIYSFEVLVQPATTNYYVKIVDETINQTFTNATPYRFRDLTPATHTFLHFGIQATPGTDVRSFDLDSVSVTQAALPPNAVILTNPVYAGGNFSFSFQSQTGVSYITRYLGNLSSSSWTSLITNVGSGNLMTVTHTNVPVGPLFYRVEVQ